MISKNLTVFDIPFKAVLEGFLFLPWAYQKEYRFFPFLVNQVRSVTIKLFFYQSLQY